MRVAIQGMGLTTFDVLSALTEGRGGKFFRSDIDNKLVYIPSGQEPIIIAFSRSGLPLSARARNQKGASGQYQAKFLTLETVKKLRRQGKIDFEKQILPLLIHEMEYVYYEAYVRAKEGFIAASIFCNHYCHADKEEKISLINKNIPKKDQFSWHKLCNPIPPEVLISQENFSDWLHCYCMEDLAEAGKGNADSPIKAASDVLRDLRDIIRQAVDFSGLTENSHRWLNTIFVPIMNRIAVGPPKKRIEEMLALINSGVLKIDFGPNAQCQLNKNMHSVIIQSNLWAEYQVRCDVLIQAKINTVLTEETATPLWRNILSKGYAYLCRNGEYFSGGIAVSENMQVLNHSGAVHANLWAIGLPTEGSKFYTFIMPRPGVNSTAIIDAEKAVSSLIEVLKKHTEPEENAI